MKIRSLWLVCGVVSALMCVCKVDVEAKPPQKLFDEHEQGATDGEVEPTITIRSGQGSVSGSTTGASMGKSIKPVIYKHGTMKLVEAKVGGRNVLFLLDTGASYTTLTPWFAKLIGSTPSKDAPSASFKTANGVLDAPFGTVSSFKLGGVELGPVTFSLCESCGEQNLDGFDDSKRKVVGLLGMNVLGRHAVSMEGDHLELRIGSEHQNQSADVRPWIELSSVDAAGPVQMHAGRTFSRIKVKLKNKSKHTLRSITMLMFCRTNEGVQQLEFTFDNWKAGSTITKTVAMNSKRPSCIRSGFDVLDARW